MYVLYYVLISSNSWENNDSHSSLSPEVWLCKPAVLVAITAHSNLRSIAALYDPRKEIKDHP